MEGDSKASTGGKLIIADSNLELSKYLGFTRSSTGASSSADDQNDMNGENGLILFCAVITFSTGLFLAGVRLIEPHFRFLVVEKLYALMGKLYEPVMENGMTVDEFKL